ncbi:D-alanyl-D-alanine carboxypeptidase / D-alanyl-D-alanine-endopeptidase (penicillin-binding protein 4) [Hymenobacter gelipurpurascens]|uniref:D-alanyl-D-alanine carboxypeptidase / D-alanyl-D-alanine-endopeptidase (Penicillin-binding protein 4) n=1 Tax=Hymenobacter gelipurpurascens TaxID=89968 RepID=A0A212U8X9_9BACT|nr:D-alanyl-D-alanine carboxypeptidase [Hymenobacter gelipurpurascens]SNC74676.1 D-alanyl-D-alanine carboxypeptidase / D-alanyl-D-alanine-endopeptidase (penicillin-binding protein 4) [Hymenobacter gelipurpurascens]
MSFFRLLSRVLLGLWCLNAAPVFAQKKAPPATPKVGALWLDQLIRESVILRQHSVGVCLTDVASGEPVYELNSDKYFTPASTMKLFSLYAGLHMLPDSLPSLHYVVRPDSLLFWGTGDPTMLHGDIPSGRALAFLQNRPEKLFYAPVPCAVAYGPGWTWDDYNYYFQPERGPFPIYGHTVRFYAKAGQPLPRVYPSFFRSLTEAAPIQYPNTAEDHVRRMELENRFFVFPSPKNWIDETPFRSSTPLLLQLLQDTLRRPVVPAALHLRAQDSVRTLRGLPVDSLYRRMLRVSDNFLAEQLLLMCASSLSPDSLSPNRVIRSMQANYLRNLPDAPHWVDGSGLSRLNLVTPRTLVALLLNLHAEVPEPRLLDWLAAGGRQGTLKRVYRDPRGPWLWGKTGTLTNNHNLCGYLRTKSGRLLAFSFMNNNHVAETSTVRKEMERVLTQVRERM